MEQNNEFYACAEPLGSTCNEWVVIDKPAPILPDFTMEEWSSLAVLVVIVLISAWGFRVLGGLIK
jgi:hypothetical protein